MSVRKPINPDVLARAKELRAEGMRWSRISARLGVSEDALRRQCDERYAERRNQRVRAWRMVGRRMEPQVVEPQASSVHADTRTRMARWMGDPPPGRSALDRQCEAQPKPDGLTSIRADRTYYMRGFLAP